MVHEKIRDYGIALELFAFEINKKFNFSRREKRALSKINTRIRCKFKKVIF